MAEKKNPDYAGSAVMLTNPPQVMTLLAEYHAEEDDIASLRKKIEASIPQALTDMLNQAEKHHAEMNQKLRLTIDEFGSYQDVETGEYAVKQLRESIIYKPELVRQYAPSKVASFVLIESVDTKALDALVKAGQLTPVQARQCGTVEEKFAYIIR